MDEVVGDSMRRMMIQEEAKNNKLIKDGDPSDIFEKIKKAF